MKLIGSPKAKQTKGIDIDQETEPPRSLLKFRNSHINRRKKEKIIHHYNYKIISLKYPRNIFFSKFNITAIMNGFPSFKQVGPRRLVIDLLP